MMNFDGVSNPYHIPTNALVVGTTGAEIDGAKFETEMIESTGRKQVTRWMVTRMDGKRVQVVQLNPANFEKTLAGRDWEMLRDYPNYTATGCFAS